MVIVVVEPHALFRFGIIQHLASTLPKSQLQGVGCLPTSKRAALTETCNLMLLSIDAHENVMEPLQAAQHTYAPERLLLLSDPATIPAAWTDLPPIVVGYIPRSATPQILAASVELALIGGKCFQSPLLAHERHAPALNLPSEPHTTRQAPDIIRAFLAKNQCSRSRFRSASSKMPSGEISVANQEAELLNITPRQYEVLVFLAHGYSNHALSEHLNVSLTTVKKHTEAIYTRLDAHNRNQAVYSALTRGATLGLMGHKPPRQ